MRRKREKTRKIKSNNKKKGERKQLYLKQQAQKEKEEAQKAKQAEKNPFSVFAEKDGEEVMDDESVVFTEPSSSDHLPKGTLSRLPLTKKNGGFQSNHYFITPFNIIFKYGF